MVEETDVTAPQYCSEVFVLLPKITMTISPEVVVTAAFAHTSGEPPLHEIAADSADPKVGAPPPVIVYVKVATLELVNPDLVANTLYVVVLGVEMAPLYVCVGELSHVPGVAAPGVDPSVV